MKSSVILFLAVLGGVITYGDYKTVDGIKFPFSIKGSKTNARLNIQEIKVNKGIDGAVFR